MVAPYLSLLVCLIVSCWLVLLPLLICLHNWIRVLWLPPCLIYLCALLHIVCLFFCLCSFVNTNGLGSHGCPQFILTSVPYGIFLPFLLSYNCHVSYVSKVWSLMLKLVETVISNTACSIK